MCPHIFVMMVTFLTIFGVLAAVSVTSSITNLQIKMDSASKSFYPDHPDAGHFRIKGYNNQTIITKNGIREDHTYTGSNQALSFLICEDISSFCNYYHPDHPSAGQHRRVKGSNSSKAVTTDEINGGITKHNTTMGRSDKRLHLQTCEDVSSSLCTSLYIGHSHDGRRQKSNHTPVIKTDDNYEILNGINQQQAILSLNQSIFISLPNINTELTSPTTSVSPISNQSPKSTTGVVKNSFGEYFASAPNIGTTLTIGPTSPSTSAVSILHKSRKSTRVILANPASSRNWKEGHEGTKWDMNCDFNRNDIGACIWTLWDSECMDMCIQNNDCTHWTYNMLWRKCCLKKADQMTEKYDLLGKCGFIPGRSKQKY